MGPQLRQLHSQLWALAEPLSLRQIFDGTALLAPLGTGSAAADPAEKLVENAALLYAVCARTAHPEALAAAVEEARSLLFFCLSDAGGNLFWHVPFASHTGDACRARTPIAHVARRRSHTLGMPHRRPGHAAARATPPPRPRRRPGHAAAQATHP